MNKPLVRAINLCRYCDSGSLDSFLDLGSHPFANSLLHSREEDEALYPLHMVLCASCGMAQLTHTADPVALFSHYVWVTGTSSTARNQAYRFCADALERMPNGVQSYVLEVASNDGTYLRPFIEKGVRVLGVDPAENIVQQANSNGVQTEVAFFGLEIARDVTKRHGHPDLVIARNVLAHVANPVNFVQGIAHLIGSNGLAAIEFHYGRKILEGLQYDSIYHEHLCYITAHSVVALLKRCGLDVVGFAEGPISGGSLIVYARREGAVCDPSKEEYLDRERTDGVNLLDTWRVFGQNVFHHREALRSILKKEIQSGRKVVGYGASARSSTMLNFCGITYEMLPVIADQNPMKHGLFTAGTRIPIRPPEDVFGDKPDTVLILSWNFLEEIKHVLKNRFGFVGRIIAPLPDSPTLSILT